MYGYGDDEIIVKNYNEVDDMEEMEDDYGRIKIKVQSPALEDYLLTTLWNSQEEYLTGYQSNPIRFKSSKPMSENTLYLDDLEKLTKLTIQGYTDIDTLNGLEFARNLEILNIINIGAVDCSIISKLYNLKELNISNSTMPNLEELNLLENLEKITLKQSYLNKQESIKTLNGIENFINLKYLEIENSDIYDISPLMELEKLETIKINGTRVVTISEMGEKPLLREFECLDGPEIEDLEHLLEYSNTLEYITVPNYELPFAIDQKEFTELRSLQLGDKPPIKFTKIKEELEETKPIFAWKS